MNDNKNDNRRIIDAVSVIAVTALIGSVVIAFRDKEIGRMALGLTGVCVGILGGVLKSGGDKEQ